MTGTTPTPAREQLRKDLELALGGGMIDLEADADTINYAINRAFGKFRQRSSNSVQEAWAFLTIEPDINEYTLPKEVVEVREVYRRRMGTGGVSDGVSDSGGIQYDPFDLAFTNLYLLQAGSMGGLLTFNLYNQYLNTASLMFGGKYNFTFNPVSKVIQIVRAPRDHEEVLLWIYTYEPEEAILADTYANQIILELAIAYLKMSIGEAREKFANLAGPQGGVQLNGAAMKAEGLAELARLDEVIRQFGDGGTPLSFVIG